MTDKQIKKIAGFKVDKLTEDKLMDFSRYELVDIILAYRQEYNELTRVHTELNKQLKRKEKELQEAMDNYVQLDLQRVKEYNKLVDLYKAKEQECEELKAEVKKQKEIAKEYEQRWLNSYGV